MPSSYCQTVLQHLVANYGRMYHEPTGRFRHPYIVPGAGYEHCLWDWDTFFASRAIQFAIFPYESFPIEENYAWDWHRRMLADFVRARPLFYGDYYPLLANSADYDVWAAFQMNRPDLGEGMLLAFRRKDAPFISADFRMQGLDPAAEYELQDADTGKTWKQTGNELRERGLRVELAKAPESRLVFYRRIP